MFRKKINKKRDVDPSKPHLFLHLRRLMGKPVEFFLELNSIEYCSEAKFLTCEDKDADQQCGNRAYDQPHCFCYLDPSSPSSLYPSSEAALARLCIAQYRFSHDGAHCCIRTIVVFSKWVTVKAACHHAKCNNDAKCNKFITFCVYSVQRKCNKNAKCNQILNHAILPFPTF